MNEEEKIKTIINSFFEKMGIAIAIEKVEKNDGIFFVNLKSPESNLILGKEGENLNKIQKVLNSILKKQINKDIYVEIDVYGYKKKKKEYLEELAKNLADEVALTKKAKILPPMSAKERRIIHLALSERKDVKTESFGQEPERRVVIKPISDNSYL